MIIKDTLIINDDPNSKIKFELIQSLEEYRSLLKSLGAPTKVINDNLSMYSLAQFVNGNLFAIWGINSNNYPYESSGIYVIWSEDKTNKRLKRQLKQVKQAKQVKEIK